MDGGEADGLSGLMRCDSERAESSFTGSATHNVLTVATGTGAVACVLWFAGISTFQYVLAHVQCTKINPATTTRRKWPSGTH